ncbi:MAG: hypothetical protein KGL42_17265 [Betaproteobacteria bacterium]|nr:hypothetical protein [Betaproteobacteria bacterium]
MSLVTLVLLDAKQNRGALTLALNSLRRGTQSQSEIADEVEKTARPAADDARDAARYRTLRRGQRWSVVNGIGDTLRADGLDAAIDAALQEQKP